MQTWGAGDQTTFWLVDDPLYLPGHSRPQSLSSKQGCYHLKVTKLFPPLQTVCSPLFVPPAPDVGPGDDTTALYVGGGGGGGVVRLPLLASLGELTVSAASSLGGVVTVFLGCSVGARARGGRTERVAGSSGGGVPAGGVLALAAEAGGTPGGEVSGGGDEAGGDASSFGGAGGGEVAVARGFRSSGVEGPEGTGGAAGSSEGDGDVGRGGAGSCFGGGEVGRGGAGSSGGGGDVGKGGAGDSGGGGEAGKGGAGSSGGGGEERSGGAGSFGWGVWFEDSSLKQTHVSPVSSPTGAACSGPKRLSKSAVRGFLSPASVEASGTQTTADQSETNTGRWNITERVDWQRMLETGSWGERSFWDQMWKLQTWRCLTSVLCRGRLSRHRRGWDILGWKWRRCCNDRSATINSPVS